MPRSAATRLLRACTLALLLLPALAWAGCEPPGWSRQQLNALKADEFRVASDADRSRLALDLLGCLESPDPALRDGVAFEAWYTWLRAGQLDEATRARAMEQLLPRISPTAPPGDGFGAPFAALVLSEIARTDRVQPWLQPDARERLVQAGTAYLSSVRDYRGFDPQDGWRHGVAHGADLLLQLALNPAVDKPQLDRILAAVATQAAPAGHAYVFGEPERLARPVLYTAVRGLHSAGDWQAWFEALTSPAPAADWRAAVATSEGLVRRHDLRALLLAMHVEVVGSENPGIAAMRPALEAAIKRLP